MKAETHNAGGRLSAYVEAMMPDLYGAFWMRRRIAQEVADHLYESVERLRDQGMSSEEAEARALSDFGPPAVVARAFAQMKGIGVTTNFTRWSGIALIAGVLTITVTFVAASRSVAFEHSVFAPIAFTGLALVGIGLAGVYVRLRGQLGRTARVGVRMVFLGVPGTFISGALWFLPGYALFLPMAVAGFGVYLVAMTRSSILPRRAVALLWCGVGALGLTGAVGLLVEVDVGAGGGVGMLLVAGGLVWIGSYLWSERLDETRAESPAAIA